jgi:hypothetical protein
MIRATFFIVAKATTIDTKKMQPLILNIIFLFLIGNIANRGLVRSTSTHNLAYLPISWYKYSYQPSSSFQSYLQWCATPWHHSILLVSQISSPKQPHNHFCNGVTSRMKIRTPTTTFFILGNHQKPLLNVKKPLRKE